jgi:hypothetical protein
MFTRKARDVAWRLKGLRATLASSTDLQVDCRFLAATALNLVLNDLSFVEGTQTSTFDSAAPVRCSTGSPFTSISCK